MNTPTNTADRLRQGHALQMQGKLAEAGALYREVLDKEPRNAPALNLMGTLALQSGQIEPGINLLRQALEIMPGFAPAHDNLGKGLEQLGQYEEAAACYGRVIALAPNFGEGYANRARALEKLGRLDAALKDLDKALSFKGDPELALHRGTILLQLARNEEALTAFDKAIAMGLTHPIGRFNRGVALMALNRPEEALAAYDDAIARQPEYADAYCNRGFALEALGRPEDALASHEQALAINPDLQDGYLNRGGVLIKLGRHKEAVAAYDAMLSRWPDYAPGYNNRGTVLKTMGLPDKALADFRRAASLAPGDVNILYNLGWTQHGLGRFDEAMHTYDSALAIEPMHQLTNFSKSTLLLQTGRFAEGWALYQSREHIFIPTGLEVDKRWSNPAQDIAGKTVLLFDDQGMGDAIQFSRFLAQVKARGANPVVMMRASMLRLMEGLGVTLSPLETVPEHDLHAPLASLPFLLGVADAVAVATPYLAAEDARIAKWKKKIGTKGYRIGICWQGKTQGRNDPERSFPLAALAPLAALPGVRLISLQKGDGEEQIAELPDGMTVEELSSDFDAGADAFVDSAAVMQSLDLVISCDTSIAHLAGALGRPVWTALKQVPEWRWQTAGQETPWYSSMTLFRQPRRGDWESVFIAMADRLKTEIA